MALYQPVVRRDIFGRSHALSYSDLANELEDAITKALATATAAAPSSPTP